MLRSPRRRAPVRRAGAAETDGSDRPPRGPQHHFVTLDPGLRVDRRRNPERRATVERILATIPEDDRRAAYLRTVRSTASVA